MLDNQTLGFLEALADNNDKTWFDAHRSDYDAHFIAPARALVSALEGPLQELCPQLHAVPKVNGSMMRIHRDTRFSKDKTPYKTHLDLMFWQGTGRGRECPALYFRLEPGGAHVGGGKHGFDKTQLPRFRDAVAGDRGEELQSLLAQLQSAGYTVGGAHYKRVPRGYDAEHPRAELLKYNGVHAFTVLSPDVAFGDGAVDLLMAHYRTVHPLVDWLADVLES